MDAFFVMEVLDNQFALTGKQDAEAVIGLLDDPSDSVRFYARYFLMRRLGYIPLPEEGDSDSTKSWNAWWNGCKEKSGENIRDQGLARCLSLVTHPNKEFRGHALSLLMAYSVQPYYGDNNTEGCWGSANAGERSASSWKKYLALAKPFNPKSIKRATLQMNLDDLKSNLSFVREIARESIQHIVGSEFPLNRESLSHCTVRDSFNDALAAWVKAMEF